MWTYLTTKVPSAEDDLFISPAEYEVSDVDPDSGDVLPSLVLVLDAAMAHSLSPALGGKNYNNDIIKILHLNFWPEIIRETNKDWSKIQIFWGR